MMWGKSPGEGSWMPVLPSRAGRDGEGSCCCCQEQLCPLQLSEAAGAPSLASALSPEPASLGRALKSTVLSKGPHQPWQLLLVCCSRSCLLGPFLQSLFVSSWCFFLEGVQQVCRMRRLVCCHFKGSWFLFHMSCFISQRTEQRKIPTCHCLEGFYFSMTCLETIERGPFPTFPSTWGALGHHHKSQLCSMM